MDCKVEAAVLWKAGLGRGTPVMLTPAHGGWHHQQYPRSPLPPPSAQEGEPYCSATEPGGLLWDDFSVDDLLDLGDVGKEQHGDEGEEFLRVGDVEGKGEEGEESTGGWCNSNTSSSSSSFTTTTTASAVSFQTVAVPPSSSDPIIVPAGDVEDLEWVSRFVDDSYSEFAAAAHAPPFANLHAPAPEAAVKTGSPKASSTSSGTPLKRYWHSCSFSTASVAVPAKARSKRPRTGGRLWFLGPTSFLSEPSSSSCSSVSSSSSCSVFSSVTSFLGDGGGNAGRLLHSLGGTPRLGLRLPQALKKKKGRKPKVVPATAPEAGGGNGGDAEQEARRHCSHCGVEKTPQWRAGPMGAKTLCNACGVRYKSGRLLPEYRPAGSPTFLSHVHSNSHSKVLEIRRSKELIAAADTAASCSPSPPQQPAGPTRPYGVV